MFSPFSIPLSFKKLMDEQLLSLFSELYKKKNTDTHQKKQATKRRRATHQKKI